MIKAYLTVEDVTTLEMAGDNMRDRLLIRLLFRLGCRVTEALGLTIEDIDFERSTISIQHLKTRLRLYCPNCSTSLGRSNEFCSKCGSRVTQAVAKELEHRRQRILPIDTGTLKMLKEYIERGGLVIRNGKQLLFGVNRHRSWQIIKECAVRAGLPKLINPETGKVHNISPHRLS